MNYEEILNDGRFNADERRAIQHIADKYMVDMPDTDIARNYALEMAIEVFRKEIVSLP